MKTCLNCLNCKFTRHWTHLRCVKEQWTGGNGKQRQVVLTIPEWENTEIKSERKLFRAAVHCQYFDDMIEEASNDNT